MYICIYEYIQVYTYICTYTHARALTHTHIGTDKLFEASGRSKFHGITLTTDVLPCRNRPLTSQERLRYFGLGSWFGRVTGSKERGPRAVPSNNNL